MFGCCWFGRAPFWLPVTVTDCDGCPIGELFVGSEGLFGGFCTGAEGEIVVGRKVSCFCLVGGWSENCAFEETWIGFWWEVGSWVGFGEWLRWAAFESALPFLAAVLCKARSFWLREVGF